MISITQLRKGSTTDSDANDDKLLQDTSAITEVAASGEVELQNVDVMACSSVVCKVIHLKLKVAYKVCTIVTVRNILTQK